MNPTNLKENFLKEKMPTYDLFILAAEDSADVHGTHLINELLKINPSLKILVTAGPRMRALNIDNLLKMEDFQVMGFIDVIFALPRLIKNFFYLRKKILKLNPKVCIFIDYPDFNLRLEKSLRKKGYKNKLIHYISPTIWAWRKKRADFMAKYLDLLITIFPFEKKYFSHTSLNVTYIGHPLALAHPIESSIINKNVLKDLIGIFPGSRKKEIENNLPIQLKACRKLINENKNLKFAISVTNEELINKIFKKEKLDHKNFIFFPREKNSFYMQKLKMAMATSGTITLELALKRVPTVVNFAIKPLDLFIARRLLKINLEFYCIVNIILNKRIFFELYGPNLSENSLYECTQKILLDENFQKDLNSSFDQLHNILYANNPSKNLANIILSNFKKNLENIFYEI